MTRTYLDHNATSPLRPEAAAAMADALRACGNPSSVHAEGRRARGRIEAARETVAGAVGALTENVVFTGGATEAVNLAVASAVEAGAGTLFVSAIEHDSVREAAAATGVPIEAIPALRDGRVDAAWLEARLAGWNAADGRPFVAVMHANNETGVIQPLAQIADAAARVGAMLLVDAAQTLGKIDVDLGALGATWLAVSAHKLGGPAGAGALVLAPDAPVARQQHGGRQERGRRAGTENFAGIVGFAAALEAARSDRDMDARLGSLRDRLEAGVRAVRPDARVWGADAPRLGTASCLSLAGFPSETQVMALDLAGVAVSAGAACSSGKVRASHVLLAMSVDKNAAGSAIRASLGWNTTEADIDRFVEAYAAAAARKLGPAEPALADAGDA
jgi:cysteine desulfurase